MAMDGSVSHCDADTISENEFGLNFKEYMLKEKLKWSLYKRDIGPIITYDVWVFWSEQDREIAPSHSVDNCPDFNPNVCAVPKVRDNIRRALQKLIVSRGSSLCLFQFWAPTTTLEGRTKLTTQYQPFALGAISDKIDRMLLCEYRMKCNFFYADAESEEEQLGLHGRVFLHLFPESTLDVKYYSTKEYPQRDLAVSCQIHESWAVPVFEHFGQTCVGVLEIVSLYSPNSVWVNESFVHKMHHILQEFGLQCFDGYKICKMRSRENVITNNSVFQELETVIRLVCETHRLPLAMAWVPCSACNGLRPTGVKYCARIDDHNLATFLRVSGCSHLRKGWVARRALSSYMLYFPSITRLSVEEYPLVPYARMCEFSGWFIICLQNSNTRDDKYVLEFFWSTSSEDSEDIGVIQKRLNKILGMMAEKLGNFRFSSGENVGDLSYVEVFNAQNDPKKGSFYEIQATKTFSSRDSEPSSVSSSASVSNLKPW